MMDQKFQLDRLPPTDCTVNQCNPSINVTHPSIQLQTVVVLLRMKGDESLNPI
jgi:hypothetical protein